MRPTDRHLPIAAEDRFVHDSAHKRGDMAILLVEQYLDFAHELADDFAVMDRGEIVMSGTRETFDTEAVRRHMTV
jgi:urea transport system ATP-binding protein